MSPSEKGTCADSYQRYAYNVNMAKCLLFEYSGCEGIWDLKVIFKIEFTQ